MSPRLRLSVLLTLALLLPWPAGLAEAQSPPQVGAIQARLHPPTTTYTVAATDPDGDALTYAWSNTNKCGTFASNGPQADWGHGDDTNCGHDSVYHPGTITVVVRDAAGNAVTRVYYAGSGDGIGSAPNVTTRCAASLVSGAFEPTQGVWQDDETFPDKPGKKLLQVDGRHYVAELDLVKDRDTTLVGVRGQRDVLDLRGFLSGTVEAPTLLRVTLVDGSGERVLLERDAGMLPVEGTCGEEKGFHVEIPAPTGLPEQAFRPAREGPYVMRMELVVKDGGPVAETQVEVEGYVRAVRGFRTIVVPAVLTGFTNDADPRTGYQPLATAATRIASDLAKFVPDYFPLARGAVTATAGRGVDFRSALAAAEPRCERLAAANNGTRPEWCTRENTRVAVTGEFRAQGWSARADRVVTLLRDGDFDSLGANATGWVAVTVSTKVIFGRPSNDHWDVAHEIAHTYASFPWSDEQMNGECGLNFHNTGTYGNGLQLTLGGAESRAPKGSRAGLMGPATAAKDYWIEQCTYWHLIRALNRPVDPEVFAIRGWVARDGALLDGAFEPGLTFMGEPDADPNATGEFAVVLRDASGGEVARYAFQPPAANDRGEPVHLTDFGMVVPLDVRATRFELEGPSGVLDARNVTPRPPVVTLTATPSGGGADLAWSIEAASSDLVSWVQVSGDGGETWDLVAPGSNGTSLRLDADRLFPGANLVRVVVSDGVRSGEATATVAGPAPATPTAATPTSTPTAGSTPAPTGPTKEQPLPGALLALLALALVAIAARRRR